MNEELTKAIAELGEDADKPVTWRDLLTTQMQILNLLSDSLLENDKHIYDKVGEWINQVVDDYNTKFYFTMGMLYGEPKRWMPAYEEYYKKVNDGT